MFDTVVTRRFGLKVPIINAGMAFVAGPELAAAVANAGGLGMLGGAMVPPDGLRMMIAATRSLTASAFGVDLIGDFVTDDHIEVLVETRMPVAVFFWTMPSAVQVARLREGGVSFWAQVGSVAEARAARDLGAEALIVQGAEAGGHNRSAARREQLFADIRRACTGLPLIAAGGISDGRTMVEALNQGAEAVWCGTRFLATVEAEAHDGYKARVVAATAQGTEMTTVFGPEWPGQPLRALVNRAVVASRGRVDAALAETAGEVIGTMQLGPDTVPVPRYSALLPNRSFKGDLDWICLTAGESAARVASVEPAGKVVAQMLDEARAALREIVD